MTTTATTRLANTNAPIVIYEKDDGPQNVVVAGLRDMEGGTEGRREGGREGSREGGRGRGEGGTEGEGDGDGRREGRREGEEGGREGGRGGREGGRERREVGSERDINRHCMALFFKRLRTYVHACICMHAACTHTQTYGNNHILCAHTHMHMHTHPRSHTCMHMHGWIYA